MPKSKLKVSVITVVYNGEKYLEETIKSVINQTYNNIEYIIIDGGSTDGTVEIIKKYEDNIGYWLSERDNGIYDAMNKGLSVAKGDIIGIINADDYYTLDALEVSVKAIEENAIDYSIGRVKKIPSNLVVSPTYPLKEKIYQGMMYPHIGAFIKKEVYANIGFFDTSYKVSADFDMAMRIHVAGYKAMFVNHIIGSILEGGISAGDMTKKENMQIAIKYGRNPFYANILYYKYFLKTKIKYFIPTSVLKYLKNK